MGKGLVVATLVVALAALVGTFIRQVKTWQREKQEAQEAGRNDPSRQSLPPGLRVTVGSLFVVLSVPFFYENWDSLETVLRDEPLFWLVFLFPAVGIGLILSGLYSNRQTPFD